MFRNKIRAAARLTGQKKEANTSISQSMLLVAFGATISLSTSLISSYVSNKNLDRKEKNESKLNFEREILTYLLQKEVYVERMNHLLYPDTTIMDKIDSCQSTEFMVRGKILELQMMTEIDTAFASEFKSWSGILDLRENDTRDNIRFYNRFPNQGNYYSKKIQILTDLDFDEQNIARFAQEFHSEIVSRLK